MTDRRDHRTVALILDTSAITGFARGSLAVGELLAEIDIEGGCVLVPLPCLVEAAALITEEELGWLDILLGHAAAQLVVDDPDDWRMVAGVHRVVGGYPHALAAWLALECGADVMTRNPHLYAGLGGGGITLPFDD
ncbi:hypothetical protein Q0Z83_034350 [Actinoplanes sichuanensis]|uniref:PIN domain-containing protein n=1 Tax=Actinoplanes sichuanensis TaxID=512349 RepID=A0ABW4ATN0_9ACTN|nr:hypothetical protein [Actinoplanes sichuanensis]BEL05244.1 hypothetical protein Q0Z83_034350 [Actinoplanes sichuanensis]